MITIYSPLTGFLVLGAKVVVLETFFLASGDEVFLLVVTMNKHIINLNYLKNRSMDFIYLHLAHW